VKSAATELVEQTDIKVPKFSMAALSAAAFEHFDSQRKGEGAPCAKDIAQSFLSNNGTCTSQEQASNEKKRKGWIAKICVEYFAAKWLAPILS
jgi:hypothetical protein